MDHMTYPIIRHRSDYTSISQPPATRGQNALPRKKRWTDINLLIGFLFSAIREILHALDSNISILGFVISRYLVMYGLWSESVVKLATVLAWNFLYHVLGS